MKAAALGFLSDRELAVVVQLLDHEMNQAVGVVPQPLVSTLHGVASEAYDEANRRGLDWRHQR